MSLIQLPPAPAPANSAGLSPSDRDKRAESGEPESGAPFAELLDGERAARETTAAVTEPAVVAPVAAESVPVTLAELLAVAAPVTNDPAAPVPAPLPAAAAATVAEAAPMPASSVPIAATAEPALASTTATTAIAAAAPAPAIADGPASAPGAPTPSPSQPNPASSADADPAPATTAGQPAELPELPTVATAAATTAVPAAEATAQPATAQAAPPTPAVGPGPTAPPATTGAAAPTPLPARAVALEHAVDTVKLALRAAAEHGVSHARISLSPRELGGVEVHLRHTSEGVVARVVAEHAGAAQLLQHAAAELRRAFEAQGLTLLQLDVVDAGPQGDRAAGEQRGFHAGPGDHRRTGREDSAPDDAPSEGTAGAATDTTLQLPNGVLVDVLA